MKEYKKPLYVTTSIAYVNGAPHVGFAMESIQADVIARWGRFQNRETFFSTGTDEHGEKIQKTAEKLHTTPQELCTENAEKFKKLDTVLNISNDIFIRTSDQKKHFPNAQKIWKILEEKGDIKLKKYTDKYCYGCEAFMLEKDLDENGNCPNHLRAPEEISEENYFFTLSKYSQKIAKLIESDALEIIPKFRKNEILQMAKEGFHDVSFSRPSKKIPWGVPVPGDDSQNMYVWCDALTNYFSSIGYSNDSEKFKKFWNDAEVVHVIGKDIVRFHAGIWIGMLLSAGIKIPNKIFIHGFLTSEGHKMSKSLGNVVDPFIEVENYGVDSLRYFLLREVPIGNDADFSRSRFEKIYQAHLANGLGNLVSRVYNLCKKSGITHIPESLSKHLHIENRIDIEGKNNIAQPFLEEKFFVEFLLEKEKNLNIQMEKMMLHEAIAEIFSVVDFCDKYINETKPWELQKTNPEKNTQILHDLLSALVWIARHLSPFLPDTAHKIGKIFGVHNTHFGDLEMLFPRIEKLDLPEEKNKNIPAEKNINFSVSQEAHDAGIFAEYLVLQNISVKKTPKGIQKFCKQEAKKWLDLEGKENEIWKNRIFDADKIKEKLGFSPEKNINASQSLANLVIKNGKLPSFTNIVDLYNIISLKHGVSAGAHDCAFLEENVRIDLIKGDEQFEPMKGKEHMNLENYPLQKGEYAFLISDDEIGCRFDSGQCEKSKILEGNKNILIYFQSPVSNPEWAKCAMEEFCEVLQRYGLTS